MSARTNKKNLFVKAMRKHNRKQAKAAATVVRAMRQAKLRPGASGVYRTLLNPRVQGFLGLEKKYFDTAIQATQVITNPAGFTDGIYNPQLSFADSNSVSAPSQGPGPQQRIGKSITITGVYLRGTIFISSQQDIAARPNAFHYFVALVLDTQTNGAQCTSSDIFQNQSAGVSTIHVPLRNLINSKRFRILKSEHGTVQANDYSSDGSSWYTAGMAHTFDFFVPLELQVNFADASGSDIANVIDNSLHVVASSNYSGYSFIEYNARIRFLG